MPSLRPLEEAAALRDVEARPRVLDLFCGAGGLSTGFERAGFRTIAGLDFDPVPLEAFARNHPHAVPLLADIREVSSESLASLGPIEALIGGPSCQGFSTHGKRIAEDPRNFLFREFVRVARDLRPPWVVIENVKGLLWYDKGQFRRSIHEAFEELGYRIESRILAAVDYGLPQRRERIVFIGTLTDSLIPWPLKSHGPDRENRWRTVRDAISDLPRLGLGGSSSEYATAPESEYQGVMRHSNGPLTFHEARPVSALALSVIERIPEGQGIRAIPQEDLPARFKRMRTISTGELRRDATTLYHRLAWDLPSYTITTNFRNVSAGPFVHPTDDRALSYREAARLQSFPDDYVFAPRLLPRQIGNAVPPILAEAIGSAILSAMRDHNTSFTDWESLVPEQLRLPVAV